MKKGGIIKRDNEGRCVTIKMSRNEVIKEIVTNDELIVDSAIEGATKNFFFDCDGKNDCVV